MLIFMPCFKSIIIIKIGLKLSYFYQKNTKFSSAGGSAPRPPCLQRLGAFPPDPQSPAVKGYAPTPQNATAHWRPVHSHLIADFLPRAWSKIRQANLRDVKKINHKHPKFWDQAYRKSVLINFVIPPTKFFWIRHWMLPQATLQNSLEFCETQKFSQRFVLLI